MSDSKAGLDSAKIVGQRLQLARQAAGFSLEQAAQLVQLSSDYLSNVESGSQMIESSELLRLCACYGADRQALVAGVTDGAALSLDESQLAELIGGMLSDASPDRGRGFRGLVSLLRGKK